MKEEIAINLVKASERRHHRSPVDVRLSGKGCDIISFSKDGKRQLRYIEVKARTDLERHPLFFLTEGEYKALKKNKGKAYVYVVFKKDGKLTHRELKSRDIFKNMTIKPTTQYRVYIKSEYR